MPFQIQRLQGRLYGYFYIQSLHQVLSNHKLMKHFHMLLNYCLLSTYVLMNFSFGKRLIAGMRCVNKSGNLRGFMAYQCITTRLQTKSNVTKFHKQYWHVVGILKLLYIQMLPIIVSNQNITYLIDEIRFIKQLNTSHKTLKLQRAFCH